MTYNTTAIRTIIFDLGNVIVDFSHNVACERIAAHSPYTADHIYRKIFASRLVQQFDTGHVSPETFFSKISDELHVHIEKNVLQSIWNSIFSLNRDTEKIIRLLQGRFRLLCLSNTNPWHFDYCMRRFSVLKSFDSFILSFQAGALKPQKKIFRQAILEAHALPEQCLFIDDIELFVEAAKHEGIQAIHFISADRLSRALKERGLL